MLLIYYYCNQSSPDVFDIPMVIENKRHINLKEVLCTSIPRSYCVLYFFLNFSETLLTGQGQELRRFLFFFAKLIPQLRLSNLVAASSDEKLLRDGVLSTTLYAKRKFTFQP